MNKNLNLVEILKDCPKGTKLYSPLAGEVEFKSVLDARVYSIITSFNERTLAFTKEGFYYDDASEGAECLLFPSKDQRDWSKFKTPWHKKKSEPKFHEGDWLCANELNNYANLIKIVKIVDVFGKKRYKISRDYDSDLDLTEFDFIDKHYHLWTIQDAKDGDVLVDEDNNIGIFQECEGMYWYSYTYLGCDDQLRGFSIGGSHEQTDTHPATKEQRDLLFQKIKEAGYKWNAETNTFEKLVEPKFKVGDKIVNSFMKYMGTSGTQGVILEITDDRYIFTDGRYLLISNQDSWDLVSNRFDRKTLDDEMIKTAILNHLKKMWGNCQDDICGVHVEDAIDWVEKQGKKSSWKPSKEEMDVLYSLSYITNEYDEHKEDVITHLYQDLKREFFNDSSYENMFSLDNKEDDVRRRSTIQFLEYVRSLDAYNQYGKADIDKNIAWLKKQGKPNPYSGVSFKYNGHTWCMGGRDNGVEILVDGEIKERIFLDNKPKGKSALEAIKKEKGYPISLNREIPTFEETMKDIQTYNAYKEEQWIEKACKWLREQKEMIGISFQEDFIERFKMEMKN